MLQSLLGQCNSEDTKNIENLHKIFNVKTEVDLIQLLMLECPHRTKLLPISIGEAEKNMRGNF